MLIGSKLFYLDEVDSTNEYAKRIIDSAANGSVVLADRQTAGKGRLERAWYSPEGGIWMSVILKQERRNLVAMVACLAVCELFSDYEILLGIKWPNDIMLNGKKVAGILGEQVEDTMVVGIGLNLNVREFPKELRANATSIFIESGNFFDRMDVFQALCRKLDYHYAELQRRDTEIMAQARKYTIMLGKSVVVDLPDRRVAGKVVDLSNDGGLVVMQADDSIVRIIAGDCRIVETV